MHPLYHGALVRNVEQGDVEVTSEFEVLVQGRPTKPVALPLGAAFHRRRLSLRSTQVSTLPAALSSRWDRRRRAELAWRLARELPLPVLATHAFSFEQAAEAYACADRKDDGLIHAALRYP